MEEGEQKKINQILLQARMTLANDKKADIEAAIFDINSLSHKLSEMMLDQTQTGASEG